MRSATIGPVDADIHTPTAIAARDLAAVDNARCNDRIL